MAKRNRVAYNIQDVFFGKPKSAPFLPTDISDCIAWYDFDDESTHELSPDNSTVLWAIKDKTEKSEKLAASSTSSSPTVYRPSYNINNKTVAYFDGTDDKLTATTSTVSEGHSIFIVADQGWADDSEGSTRTYGLIGLGTGFDNDTERFWPRGIGVYRGGGSALIYAGYGSGSIWRSHSFSDNFEANIFTHQIHKNVAGSWALAPFKLNGLGVGTTNGTPTVTSNCNSLSVGKATEGFWKGNVAEIIIYDRHLDVEETKTVEKYLSEKWNVSLSASDQQIDSFEILNRINRIQNFDYTFNVSRTSEGVLGKTMEVDRPIIEPPSIDITLSYFLDGGNNENRMGFDIAHPEKTEGSIGKIGESDYKPPMLTNNFYDTGRYLDARNVYLVTNNNTENDIKEQRSGYPMFITGTAQIPKITDPNAAEYGVMAFQNCYVTSYTVDLSIESLPRAEVGLVADNATFFGSGTGINIPRFNTERGVVEHNGKEMVVPKHFEESEASVINKLVSFMPGDINLKIWKESQEDIYVSDFSAGVSSNDGWATASSTFDYPESIGGEDNAVKITATSASAYHRAYRDAGTVAGKKYKVTANVWIPSTGTNIAGFQFRYANGTSGPIIHPTPDTWYDFSYEYTAVDNGVYDGWIEFWMTNNSSVDTTSTFLWAGASNDYMYIKNVVVTEVNDSINFHSDTIQSCNITVNCNRENIAYMGHKYYADKPIRTPMTVDTTIGMVVNENLTGDFSRDIKADENYNVDILCQISGETRMKYTFSGSRFDSVNYSSSIGSNKMANLQFSTAMDHDQFTKGLFVSGKLMEIQNEITLATSGSDSAETDTDTVYEKGTDVGLSDSTTDHDILYGNNPLF